MNILILTSEYPGPFQDPENNITPVVHFFAKEWQRFGNNVLVINNSLRYPVVMHLLPLSIKKLITKKIGFSIMGMDYIKPDEYTWEGIPVVRLPIKKYIPHGDHPKATIRRQTKLILNYLEEHSFKPDLILGHWPSPQIQIMTILRQYYPHCRYALTLHSTRYLNSSRFNFREYMGCLDRIGFRNNSDAEKAQKVLGLNEKPYVCYSGIPDEYIKKYKGNSIKFQALDKLKLVYVGRLIDRKNIDMTIRALYNSEIEDYTFTIIGTGPSENKLRQLVNELGLQEKVKLTGRISREEVMKYNSESHVFVMVSSNEAFGLVYLEAMAANCITIGAYNEGIDGIIQNGENGFLSPSNDESALTDIFNRISKMTENEMIAMAEKARHTAKNMTDEKVAERYLKDIQD